MTTSSSRYPQAWREITLAGNQQLIWIGQQLHPDVPMYEVPYRFTIQGCIDPTRFASALRELIRRNEVLRTVAADDRWKYPSTRVVRDAECQIVDLSSEPDPQAAADRMVNQRLADHFDPTESLCDATLIQLSAEQWEFFLTVHHALTDAFAGRAILAALGELYQAESFDRSSSDAHDYQHFIALEKRTADEDSFARKREWFAVRSKAFSGTRFYSGRLDSDSARQTRVTLRLSKDENRSISELTAMSPFRQITPALTSFNLFATAMIAWLSRLEPQETICIGATTHGRSIPSFRQTIGLFMQLLPFRTSVDAAETFESLSRKVATESMGFLSHAQPGVMTAESQRAFDVALNVIDLSVDDFCGMPTSMRWLHNGFGDPHRKLTVSAHPLADDRWELLFDFADAVFTPEDRQRAVAHFRQTLTAMAASPKSLVADYELLTKPERVFLAEHGGEFARPNTINVWQKFDQACERSRDAIAVDGPAIQLTYAGLRQMSLTLSKRIDAARFGDLVPLLCRRDEKAILSMMGVLASGRCFLIVDAESPPARVKQLLAESGASMMLDATGDSVAVQPIASRGETSCDRTRHACYVLFTSGSTGRPNGVVIGHESFWNLLSAFESIAPLGPNCCCAWWTNVGFDVAMYEVFSALLFGRTLCIPSDPQRLSAGDMLTWMHAKRINSAYLPPFFLDATDRYLADAGSLDLKRLLVGVEPIPQSLLASIADRLPDLNLINGYGPTETTVCATLQRIDNQDRSSGPASIGRPVAGNTVMIVDAAGRQVPPGVPGELWIGGVGLANGYLANPELTRQRFVTSPIKDDQTVWYRSGDRVRMRDDGALEFLGRIDDQLKLAGVRVEPGEITAAVRQCTGVHDCLVLPQTRDGRVEKLIALVEADSGVNVDQIRKHLRGRLNPAIVPSRLIILPEFPRTTNGKVDRNQLEDTVARQLSEEPSKTVSKTTAPRNAIEFTLVSIIREVLRLSAVGTDEDFFELGGSSLDAMHVVSRANEIGIPIAIEDIFRHRDAATLARLYTDAVQPDNSPPPEASPIAELSSGQRAIWYHAQSHPQSPAYQFQVRWKANSRIDPKRTERCLRQLAHRHRALRTTIELKDGHPIPVVHDDLAPEFAIWDHEGTADKVVAAGKRPFDLASDAPLRALLVRSPDQRDTLAITVHHIAVDQHSVLLLMHEFAQLYQKGDGGLFQEEQNKGQKGEGSLFRSRPQKKPLSPFWERLVGCGRAVALPVDFGPGVGESESGALFRFSLPETLSGAIRRSASVCGVSVGTYLTAAYATLLSRYSGTDNIVIGLPVSRRENWNTDNGEIGYLIEALPFVCRVTQDSAFDVLLRQINEDFAELLTHRYASHSELSERFGTLFDTMFVPQQPLTPLKLDDNLELVPEVSDLGVAKFDITWFASDAHPEIQCAIEFRTNRFKHETIELMARHWQTLLEGLADDPSQRVGQVDFRTEVDHAAAHALNGTQNAGPIPSDCKSVCQRIHSAARETPDSVAIACGEESITYQQLVDRSDKLAARLRGAGVGHSMPVALCLSRSVEMIVSILAILKAGGGYVPFDPDLPLERLRETSSRVDINIVVGRRSGLDSVFTTVVDPVDVPSTRSQTTVWSGTPDGDTLAYILHTSGSTGQPNGVEVTHESLLRSTLARESFYVTAPQNFLMVSPIWFDSSIAGIFWTLCSGGTLVVPQDQDLQDIQRFASLFDRHQVTETLLLPSLYVVLLKHADATLLKSLRRVIVAGESCPRLLVRQHFRDLPKVRLFNEYGPTEASVWSTAAELKPADEVVSIGRSVAGTPVCLLDQRGASVPIGGIGEIHIGGPRLATGYRGDPELTTQKFVPDPRPDHSGRLYRTGDLARLRRDGSLVFLGRVDGQIKVNGVRVEPTEIESAMVGIDGILQAAVVMVGRDRQPVSNRAEDLIAAFADFSSDEAHRWIEQAERFGRDLSETFSVEDDNVRLSMVIKHHDFISTPRTRQRKWLLEQALRETESDLIALDRIAAGMIAGSETPHLPRDLSMEQLTEQEIMEDWQTPLMQAMADWATESRGDVLEIGFGRGVAATMIQEHGVRSHTVVEMNPHSINDHFVPWREKYAERAIRIIEGRWQDNLDQLGTYDSVFFHAFPMNEAEFLQYVASSATFAEHFFPVAAGLLRDGGVFTYLTTEIDSLSRRHQRSLLEHFDEIQLKVQSLAVPQDTKDAWWADSMVVVRAIK